MARLLIKIGPETISMIHHLDQHFTIRTQGAVEGQK